MAGNRFTVTFESDVPGSTQQQGDVARLAAQLERLNRTLERPGQRLRPGRPKPTPAGGGDETDIVGTGFGAGGAALRTGHEFSKLTGSESAFLKSLLAPTTRTGGAWDLFKGAGSIAVHDSPSGLWDGVLRAAKGAYDIAGDAAEGAGHAAGAVGSQASKGVRVGRHLAGEVLRFPPVRVGLHVAKYASPAYDAYTLASAIRSGEIKGTVNKVVTVVDTGVSGMMLGAQAGFLGGELIDPAGGGIPGAIIGGTIGALGGIGVGLKAAMRTGPAPVPRAPQRSAPSRLGWLRDADYLRWQVRTGGGFVPEKARGSLADMMRTIGSRPRVVAANLAEPFTRPLADSIQRARKLSADNVAAVLGQFRRLAPQMRQVTASALRGQVAAMERHGQVLRGTTRGLVMAINSQWPKIDPASRRAVTQALTHMSARMAEGRHLLNPQASRLAQGIRAAMQGPFGGIVKDFGSVVTGLASTVTSNGIATSSASSGGSSGGTVPALTPSPAVRRAVNVVRSIATIGSRLWGAITGHRKGGRIASLVSPGELIVHGDRSWTVPGARTAADNVLAMLPVGSAVLTDHGQALMAAGFGLDGALAQQMPHFGKGGTTGGATMGYTVHARLGQLVDRTTSIAGDRPKLLARAMRELHRVLADTELVAYRRVRQLGADVRDEIAALRRDGLRGSERRQVRRLRDDLRAVEHEVDRRLARLASNARQVLEDPASRSADIAHAIGGRRGRHSSGLYLGLDRARARHDRRAARAFRREIAAGRRAYAQSIFDSATSTPGDVLTAIGSQTGRRTGLYAQLDHARRRHDRNSARAIKAQIAAGRQAYQQRAYAQQASDLALDDLALSGSPDDPGLRQRKLDHLQAYRGALAADLDRAKRSNDFEAISDLASRLQAVGESIRDLTDATEQQRALAQQRMDLDRELADNQRRMLAVAESQPNVLLGGLVAAINGGIGGRVGLGFQTPGYAGRGVRY